MAMEGEALTRPRGHHPSHSISQDVPPVWIATLGPRTNGGLRRGPRCRSEEAAPPSETAEVRQAGPIRIMTSQRVMARAPHTIVDTHPASPPRLLATLGMLALIFAPLPRRHPQSWHQ